MYWAAREIAIKPYTIYCIFYESFPRNSRTYIAQYWNTTDRIYAFCRKREHFFIFQTGLYTTFWFIEEKVNKTISTTFYINSVKIICFLFSIHFSHSLQAITLAKKSVPALCLWPLFTNCRARLKPSCLKLPGGSIQFLQHICSGLPLKKIKCEECTS